MPLITEAIVNRGEPGATTYERAVALFGFTGTEAEYMASLRGADADTTELQAAVGAVAEDRLAINEDRGATEAARDLVLPAVDVVATQVDIATDAVVISLAQADAAEVSALASDERARDAELAAQAAYQQRDAAIVLRNETQVLTSLASQAAKFADTIALGRAGVADGQTFGVRANGPEGYTKPVLFRRDSATTHTFLHPVSRPEDLDEEKVERRGLFDYRSMPGLIAALTVNGYPTAIRLREQDGDFTDEVMDVWSRRLSPLLGIPAILQRVIDEVAERAALVRHRNIPGIGSTQIITDASGREYPVWTATDLQGGMPEQSARHVAKRVAPYLEIPSDGGLITAADRVWINGELVRVIPDMTRMSGWGSSTMEGFGSFLAAELVQLGVVYHNGGDSGVLGEHTLAQMGSSPALLSFPGNIIPATGSVGVTSSNMRSYSTLKPFAGTIGGVEGTLSSTSPQLTFTRTTPGVEVPVAPETPFLPTIGIAHRDAAAILNPFKNDIYTVTPAEASARTREAFLWYQAQFRRVIVMGHALNRDTPDVHALRDWVNAINPQLREWSGPFFFDLQGYLMSPQLWIDAELTPTQADLDAQARGNKAPSVSIDDQHLNTPGYRALARALVRFMVNNLRWYRNANNGL